MLRGRKLAVWLFSLLAVLGLYFIITRSSGLPKIILDKSAKESLVVDNNISQSPGGVGMIGDVGVGGAQKATYTHLNDKKEIDREFGFEKLLHEVGDEWEMEKPFMNIFKKDFECRITSDSGKVQVQTAAGKPVPKDASLTGNVVIHIVPVKSSAVKESFIYLDDIIYISERSQFSTDGPVKFVNADAKMTGKGLELIYNEQNNRVDFMKIIQLYELNLRIPSKKTQSSPEGDSESKSQTVEAGSAPASNEPLKSDVQSPPKEKKGDYYKCMLSGNIVISSPAQVVFADELYINDIFLSKGEKSDDNAKQNSTATATTPTNETSPEQSEPNKPQEFTDVKVTCDNSVVVIPMDSKIPYSAPAVNPATNVTERATKACGQANKRDTFAAKKVDYNMSGGTIVLDGDCLCTGFKQELNFLRKYTLSAQKVMVMLSRDKRKQAFSWASGVKNVVAQGGVVQLATVKIVGEKIMGFSKLKCSRFEYDANGDKFTARGPGVIAIDNSKVEQPQQKKEKPHKFGLNRQCYAVVRDFETLVYYMESNRITADNSGGGLVIDYFPITDGKTGAQVTVNAGRMDAQLFETSDGATELSRLTATDGVTYEEKENQFIGSSLIYDVNQSAINITGDKTQPCLMNGSLVDGIRYDLKTEKFKAQVKSPGVLQLK